MNREKFGCDTPSLESIVIQPFIRRKGAKIASKSSPTTYKLRELTESTPKAEKQGPTPSRASREKRNLNPRAEPFQPKQRIQRVYVTPILVREVHIPPEMKSSIRKKKEDDITKSERISSILGKIEAEYRERGVYNKMYETSDGSQVIRIDVRSVRALEKIEEALNEVDCPPLVKIVSLSTRYSCKKNGKKKGFNLFLKFENDSQRTFARYILESYCYEEKLWVVKDIPPKVLRVDEEEPPRLPLGELPAPTLKENNEEVSKPEEVSMAPKIEEEEQKPREDAN